MKTLSDIKLKKSDREALKAASTLLRKKFPIDSIILFGSKAKGTDETESDIDLLLLTQQKLTWQERDAITDALFDIQLEYDVVISTLVVATKEWSEGIYSVLAIYDEVYKYGVAA